jgi:hypothetical protein
VALGAGVPAVTDGQENRTIAVPVTSIDDQLVQLYRRIERLEGLVEVDPAVAASPRIQRDLGALYDGQILVLAAARRAPDNVEETIALLKSRLAVAEHALIADVSDDWKTFVAGVEGELRSWNSYLERLQAGLAVYDQNARGRVKAAINEVRTRWNAVCDELLQTGDRQSQRERVAAARDELACQADKLSATACIQPTFA